MASATFIDVHDAPGSDRHPKALVTGIALSLALHVGIATLLTVAPWADRENPTPEFVVDVVQLPKPPKPKPPPPPSPAPVVQAPQPTMPLPAPPPPQLTEAPIADKSAPPPHASPSKAPPRERPATPHAAHRTVASAAPALPANSTKPESVPVTIAHDPHEDNLPSGRSDKEAAQALPDFILMQIAQHWLIDYRNPRYRNLVLRGARIELLPNGMLAPPFGKTDPWNPRAMIANYDQLLAPEAAPIRQAVETFLQAMRLAQPFRLPPDGKPNDKPRVFEIYFRLGDIPSAEAAGH